MADPEELKTHRAKLLLRMQRAREASLRAVATAADRQRDNAREAVLEAERSVNTNTTQSIERLRQAWNAAGVRRVGLSDLLALRDAEQAERAELERLMTFQDHAKALLTTADDTAADAFADAARAGAITARREHVADFYMRRQLSNTLRREEALQEDDTALSHSHS